MGLNNRYIKEIVFCGSNEGSYAFIDMRVKATVDNIDFPSSY
ncbi:MAG: hypothetical protein N4A57_00210 [Anaeromicrobium sp.]|nr:hypothetical protein [Anaeromicrobium sp.]MCT4592686.1 hypothetical protein [Anaeromicrobium sp.]